MSQLTVLGAHTREVLTASGKRPGQHRGPLTRATLEVEGIVLKVRQTTLKKHKTRTPPAAECPQNGEAL
jgi:hypothetical protein